MKEATSQQILNSTGDHDTVLSPTHAEFWNNVTH